MKKTIFFISAAFLTICIGCDSAGRYVDINTGEKIEIIKDEKTGYMIDAESKKPVHIYVDTKTGDTLYGRTGRVINGKIKKASNEKWDYDDDGFTYKDGDYKMKVEDDVNTIEEGDAYKIKDGEYKKKVEKDGDVKIKDGNTKIKIDGKTGEKKVKKDN